MTLGGPVNILLVDDQESSLVALEAVLKRPDYRLVTATSGADALSHLKTRDFVLVVLDVQMPGMDGFETASLMKKLVSPKELPIIFVTAINKDSDFVTKGYEAGAVDYLFKPFDPHILRSKVAIFVELYRQKCEIERQARELRDVERRKRELLLFEMEFENLRRYRNLADASPHIVWKTHVDGMGEYFNSVWLKYTGLSLDQSTGRGWEAALHEEDVAKLRNIWASAKVFGNEGVDIECRVLRKEDHSYRWHLMKIVPEVGRTGNLMGWLGTCTEIHDRKLSENRLKFRTELDAAIIEFSNRFLDSGAVTLGESISLATSSLGKIFNVDRCAVKLFEDERAGAGVPKLYVWNRNDEIARSKSNLDMLQRDPWHSQLCDGRILKITEEDIEDASEIKKIIAYPLRYRGKLIGAFVLKSVLEDFDIAPENSKLIRIICEMMTNGLERCFAESALQLQAENLARSNADLEQFASVASHDLQEPLRIVSNYVQLLERMYGKQLDDTAKEYIRFTVEASKRMINLIRDLLSYARVRRGDMSFDSISMQEVFHSAQLNLKAAIEDSKAIIQCDPLPNVAGDRMQLILVLQNLIGNAIKYRSESEPRIHISAENSGDAWVFQVKDNGKGIDQRYFEKVFQLFQRLENVAGGTGIGLAIAKKIVERHGGRIWLSSDVGKGSTFYFSLPRSASYHSELKQSA